MKIRFLFCLFLAAGLFACRQDAPADTGTTPNTPTQVAFKHTDNVARIALRLEPTGLNPFLSTDGPTRYVREMIFQTLNSLDPQTLAPVPLLASLPDIRKEADGGASYSFLIDESATWPNGMPVTTADVIFSMKIVLNPLVPVGAYRSYYDMVDNIITTPSNEKRFRVTTKRPYLLAEESLASLPIYPEYAYDPEGLLREVRLQDLTNPTTAQRLADQGGALKAFADQFTDPAMAREPEKIVGSGPYALESWEEGQRVTLVRKDNYWGAETSDPWLAAEPEKIIFEIITDNATMINAMRDELVDVVIDMSVDQFKNARKDPFLTERFEFSAVPGLAFYGLLFNQNHPLFRDVKTRRAIALLTDVDAIIEQLLPGLAERVTGPVLTNKTYYNEQLPLLDYSPDEALALLTEAGWSDTNSDGTLDKEIDGKREEFVFQFICPPSPTSIEIGTLVKDWLSEVGIEMDVVQQNGKAMRELMNQGDFALSIVGQGFNPTPDEFTQVWASTSVPPNGTNRGGFNNKEADQLIRQIKVTLDAQKRDPLYRRFQEILYENQPMVFLFSPSARVVVSKRLEFEPKATRPNLNFNDLTQKAWNKGE